MMKHTILPVYILAVVLGGLSLVGLARADVTAGASGSSVDMGAATVASVQAEIAAPSVQSDMMLSLQSTSSSGALITASRAVAIASSWLGRTDTPALVVHGSGQRTASDPSSDAWIVIYAGGQDPLHSDGSVIVDFMGVLIDDQSGAVLRAFGRGHQR
jgi:hypothetical protein